MCILTRFLSAAISWTATVGEDDLRDSPIRITLRPEHLQGLEVSMACRSAIASPQNSIRHEIAITMLCPKWVIRFNEKFGWLESKKVEKESTITSEKKVGG
ncbi:hypothetical protein BU24DRAFT_419130 [Aaosphaeria arxii CBS 175.79]|uniref:Uncharacterized protein n=1 Tax=Aaosphaeria arxii CBS 175.79 TaxID=1450172 RepID=A0A6A5Y3T8_9PLEO|nr:uncharacterized protein BU24DRAFT_419130 [Aaosphaeria arxii CBS 175.79]KAF2019531.1 hypothetical protein BU24DRAFT_419130 [Aaosphaeria arxii CBS 175.79]